MYNIVKTDNQETRKKQLHVNSSSKEKNDGNKVKKYHKKKRMLWHEMY